MSKITTVKELTEMLSKLSPDTKIFNSQMPELYRLQADFYRAQEEVYGLEDCKIWLRDNGYYKAAENEDLVATLYSYYKSKEDSECGTWDNIKRGFYYLQDYEEYAEFLIQEDSPDNEYEEG